MVKLFRSKLGQKCSSKRMHIALGKKGFKKLPPDCVLFNKRREIMWKCCHRLPCSLSKGKEEEDDQGGGPVPGQVSPRVPPKHIGGITAP